MPEWLLALVASSVLSGVGLTWRRIGEVNDRVDKLEVKLAEEYATKTDVDTAFDKVDKALCRFENKLDSLVMSELNTLRRGFVGGFDRRSADRLTDDSLD
jgi:hypothetical protein